jgi:hypothetical protein
VTAIWTSQISESKWRRVRRELEDNQLTMPFTSGVAHNRKTGYTFTSNYYINTSQLVLRITYPAPDEEVSLHLVNRFLNTITESSGTIHISTIERNI